MSVQSRGKERPMRSSSMIRVPEWVHATLREMSDETGQPMQELLTEAVEAMRRKRVLDMTNAAYAALRDDPTAWEEELAERAVWDVSLIDGLNDE